MPTFDTGRFGGGYSPNNAPLSGQVQSYDPMLSPAADFGGRFAPSGPVPQGLEGLQSGLYAGQRDVGLLPELRDAVDYSRYSGQIASQPTYGPTYTQPQQPQQTATAYAQPEETVAPAPGIDAIQTASPSAGGLLGSIPGVTSPDEYAQIAQTRAELGVPNDLTGLRSLSPAAARQMDRSFSARQTFGTLGGALLGGALLGPVGGLLGGYLGRNVASKSYYPDAPQPVAGQTAKGYDKGDLSDYGQRAYESSGQFRDAVDSGKGGLW
ncbi:hypothetical protein [Allorhizobium borbori]|uniref:Uncharacterized protein n=1 Tax=Allorhizobium borbori TaxID=485907 RepID=A0A7W6P280_9HYPH|nr:hypothetical protein [Allorhizobium borbori]MBB4103581.1 hypothetical protein [Allorhizobium borbori]